MQKLWAVSSGSYSDYSVSALCASEEIAAALCKRLNGGRTWSDYDVEEFPFVASMPTTTAVWSAFAWIDHDGNVRREQNVKVEDRVTQLCEDHELASVSWQFNGSAGSGNLLVVGTDPERVRHVFSDRKAELMTTHAARMNLASDEWHSVDDRFPSGE